MTKDRLLGRLIAAHPGWAIYDELIQFVEALAFEAVETDYLGNFIISCSQLVFSEADIGVFPSWLPSYVPALRGMKAAHWESTGGFADGFCNCLAERGAVFSPAGNDVELGFPLIDIPEGTYCFQANDSGASFFVNTAQLIIYPNARLRRFQALEALPEFTRICIRQTLNGKPWFEAYSDHIGAGLMD